MSKKNLLVVFSGAIFLFLSGNMYAQSDDKEMVKSVLESFCQEYYSSCFSNRTYVENSLTVTRVEQASLNQIKAYGFHSYKGAFGARYSQMEYYAYIKVNPTSITIKFYKKSQKDFFHDEDYWEDCSKTIHSSN